jgi:hypothetical protein
MDSPVDVKASNLKLNGESMGSDLIMLGSVSAHPSLILRYRVVTDI